MIAFQKIRAQNTPALRAHLEKHPRESCEYSFVNLSIWGRQEMAFVGDFLVLFSQFDRKSLYPFPLGSGDVKPVLDALIADARHRGLLFRLGCMTKENCALLESLYPGKFQFHEDRDGFDYVYAISDLATLKGKRYQSKRNFVNRFWANHPNAQIYPLDGKWLEKTKKMLDIWFSKREQADPGADFQLEKRALERAFRRFSELALVGMVLVENEEVLAMTMGSFLKKDTFDIHFEKALDGVEGAYAVINQAFATHLQEKYPCLAYLNREDDMGIPGLRQAKLSYHPHHMAEKYWAKLWEDEDEI